MKGRTSKRILSALLSLVMLLSLLPVSVFATETETTKTAALVTDASTLKAGDQIILTATANEKTYVASSLSGKYLTSIECDPAAPTAAAEVFTLGGKVGAWTLTGSGGKQLYTNAAKALNTTGNGTGTWTISIDKDNLATVASTVSECGRILYNVNNPRFLNYTSATNKSMLLPSIYKLNAGGSALEQVATPTGTVSSDIEVGKTVAFECSTEGAKLQYKIGNGAYQDYTGPVTITTSCTITVKATKGGMKDSAEATFNYRAYNVVTQYIRTLATNLESGDQVLIYNPDSGKIMTTEYKEYTTKNGTTKAQLGSAAATLSGNALATGATNAVFTFNRDTENTDKVYFTADGKYLYMDTTDLKLESASSEFTLFQLESTEGGYFVKADTANYNGNAQYLEYYNNIFTVYGMGSNTAIYTFQFFKATLVRDYVDGETPTEKVADPTASPAAGEVAKGTKITFSCATEGATILYKTTGEYQTYTDPIAVNADTTFTVKATKDGMDDSDVAAFAYTVKAEAPLFQNGDKVVIYNPANMKALSTEYSSFYNKGTDVTLTNGKLTGYTDADVWTVGVNADGTYTFSTADGQKLSMDTSYSSMPLDKANTAWEISAAKTANCFYIKNANRGNYIEWYADKGNWSSYYNNSDEALFAQQFYLVVDDGSDTPDTGTLPKAGDKVVIYSAAAQAALASSPSALCF